MDVSIDMARHLESLAAHYDQMATALKDSEAGEMYSEEDLQGKCGDRTFMAPAALTARISFSYE
jgi:autophagy-related protein 17